MPRQRLYLAITGLLLLLASVALLAVASNTQMREIDYSKVALVPSLTSAYYEDLRIDEVGWREIILLAMFVLVTLIAVSCALSFADARRTGDWGRLIQLAAIGILAGSIMVYLLSDRPLQTAQYGQPPTPGQPSGYIAFAELSGPTQVRFGDSIEIAFTMWISEGLITAPVSNLVLAPNESYIATAHLQAVNFDLDESSRIAQSNQPLSLGRSALWSWVVSPKEKRLGRQTLVVRANVQDAQGNRFEGDPYLKAEVSVTDPIGIPGPLYYILIGVGGVVSLPLWAWLYKEWDAGRKERQNEKIKELEEEVRDLKARKWWQFWTW